MVGGRMLSSRQDVGRCIAACRQCQARCEEEMVHLAGAGLPQDADLVRLVRQCAELCALHVRALEKESALARRTAALTLDLCRQVARYAWHAEHPAASMLALAAIQAARACRTLTPGQEAA